ncbi:hypothetical protein L6R53_14115 [Myxococcota bacterium]|nr:hypothetical protein [Myxococcota bacterium]
MTPQQVTLRAIEVMSLLVHRTTLAAMHHHPETLAGLARACGRVRCINHRLRGLQFDLACPPWLPDHDSLVMHTGTLIDELRGAYRVARVVAGGLARRERDHRAHVQAHLAGEVARVG